jgi:hypothetical protein
MTMMIRRTDYADRPIRTWLEGEARTWVVASLIIVVGLHMPSGCVSATVRAVWGVGPYYVPVEVDQGVR